MSNNEKTQLDPQTAKAIIESLLFINERPIETKELAQILAMEKNDVEPLIEGISNDYAQRSSGICIVKVAGGYQMCSSPSNEIWVKSMFQQRNKQKLTVPALETLAIIAYRQPITKMEIEAIRGVNADGVVKNLSNSGLIKIGGKKEVIGRPFIYVTTRKFLEYFGLNSLKDLPKIEEFAALADNDAVVQGIVQEQETENNDPVASE